MQCVSPQSPRNSWYHCYNLLLQALEGYSIGHDPREFLAGILEDLRNNLFHLCAHTTSPVCPWLWCVPHEIHLNSLWECFMCVALWIAYVSIQIDWMEQGKYMLISLAKWNCREGLNPKLWNQKCVDNHTVQSSLSCVVCSTVFAFNAFIQSFMLLTGVIRWRPLDLFPTRFSVFCFFDLIYLA